MTRVRSLLMAIVGQLLLSAGAQAHGGGLDSYGCHNDQSREHYHCHRGVLSGLDFPDKAAMLENLRELQAAGDKEPAPRSVEQRLKELQRLLDQNLITEDQYKERQEEILKDL